MDDRNDVKIGMKLFLREHRKSYGREREEVLVPVTVVRPVTTGLMADCVDVRDPEGVERMVHISRLELGGADA